MPRTAQAVGLAAPQPKPVLLGGSGSTLPITAGLTMVRRLRIKPSWPRPWVSDDDARAKAQFRTAKGWPELPAQGLTGLDAAWTWGANFARGRTFERRHPGIADVSPAQHRADDDRGIIRGRHVLYLTTRERNGTRWWRQSRNRSPIAAAPLNRARDAVLATAANTPDGKALRHESPESRLAAQHGAVGEWRLGASQWTLAVI